MILCTRSLSLLVHPLRKHKTSARISNPSGTIAGVDAHIFRGEIARPIARNGAAGAHIHNDWDVFGEQSITCGSLVKVQRLAAAQNRNTRHLNLHQRRIETDSRASGGRENAAPVWISTGKRGLHQWRSSDRLRDASRCALAFGASNFNFNNTLRPFTV